MEIYGYMIVCIHELEAGKKMGDPALLTMNLNDPILIDRLYILFRLFTNKLKL